MTDSRLDFTTGDEDQERAREEAETKAKALGEGVACCLIALFCLAVLLICAGTILGVAWILTRH